MDPSDIAKAIDHLNAALALLKKGKDKPKGRNPDWFRDTGHLTDKGIEYLNSLFEKGKTSYSIAKEMHLSYRAVALRHDEWRKKNPTAAAWIRQDGR
jgi:hypothetical protein